MEGRAPRLNVPLAKNDPISMGGRGHVCRLVNRLVLQWFCSSCVAVTRYFLFVAEPNVRWLMGRNLLDEFIKETDHNRCHGSDAVFPFRHL